MSQFVQFGEWDILQIFVQAFTICCGNHWSDGSLHYKNHIYNVSPITIKPLGKNNPNITQALKYFPLLKMHKSPLLLAEF